VGGRRRPLAPLQWRDPTEEGVEHRQGVGPVEERAAERESAEEHQNRVSGEDARGEAWRLGNPGEVLGDADEEDEPDDCGPDAEPVRVVEARSSSPSSATNAS